MNNSDAVITLHEVELLLDKHSVDLTDMYLRQMRALSSQLRRFHSLQYLPRSRKDPQGNQYIREKIWQLRKEWSEASRYYMQLHNMELICRQQAFVTER
jgi:hypothetical protein